MSHSVVGPRALRSHSSKMELKITRCLSALVSVNCVVLTLASVDAFGFCQTQAHVAELTSIAAMGEKSQDPPFPHSPPESEGVSSLALNRLNELVTGFVQAEEIVGAELLVIKNRRTVMHAVYGRDEPKVGQPLAKNTIFSIRSMTKPLAGVMAQILIDERVLKLTDPVSIHLESFEPNHQTQLNLPPLFLHLLHFYL